FAAPTSERDFDQLADFSGGRNNGGEHLQRPAPPTPPPPLPPSEDAASPSASSLAQPASTFEVTLERSGLGFGFSIAGGSDAPAPAAAAEDPRIRVTRLVPGGAAEGRLAVGDALLRVNGVDVSCRLWRRLKLAGSRLRLLVLRGPAPTPPLPAAGAVLGAAASAIFGEHQQETRVLLNKTARGLGFSIAGGMHNEHLPGDSGIFITKLIEGGAAQLDGRIAVGDRLVSVNGASLRGVTHEEAVAALKRTGQEVLLSVVKPSPEQLAVLIGMEEEAEEAAAAAAAEAAAESSERYQQQQQQVGRRASKEAAALKSK
uniref:PDZ domain-containing protein n=1 Tax=Macrostomum lignano TaxID=282301 RepID=A0A1I8GZG2_9PLAT